MHEALHASYKFVLNKTVQTTEKVNKHFVYLHKIKLKEVQPERTSQ